MKEKNILRYPPFNVDANVIDSDDGRYYDDDGGNSKEERFFSVARRSESDVANWKWKCMQ